ncbi:DUF3862 domain-containing protein [Ferrimonas sediminicola]|uniref:DUF3862 domain-containing protein n=1 Tax=Ferrimonas sediminicola TaxID=2569538 RepID=A0A4U1BJN1_9GAMM|nr:DUF3862 domain-containing protein [Ferrimonas sediminicola]
MGKAVVAGVAAGRCSRVSRESYDQLALAMSRAEVEAVLGRADSCSGSLGIATCIWGDDTHIKVGFTADRVMLFTHKEL